MRRALPWLPAVAWAAAIFWVSSQPTVPLPRVTNIDKLGHYAAYTVLGALLAFATDRSRLPLLAAFVLGALYGISDELHQSYVPGRSADPLDWAADVAGVATACFLYHRWRSRRAAADAAAGGEASFLRA